jgi:hypothetical protein
LRTTRVLSILLFALFYSAFSLQPSAFLMPSAFAAPPRITFDKGNVVVTGLAELPTASEKWQRILAVYVDRDGGHKDQPAILGQYRAEKEALHFEPRFPFVAGVRYRAVLTPDGGKPTETVLVIPKADAVPSARVAAVYPSADKLPENALKFYIHFSNPMSQGGSYRHVKLLDEKGKAVDLPFLELDQELWDPSGKRFTLFFDPGRIKRGLKPREEVGPSLEEGKRYTLVVEKTWLDAEGTPMKESFRKSFSVEAPDDKSPDPKTWKLTAPKANTRSALRVVFPKSMDHAMLERVVWVVDAAGKKVAGKVEITERETVYLFVPEKEWTAGEYQLVADRELEDVSGNSITRPFEIDVLRPVEREVKKETVKVPFRIGK